MVMVINTAKSQTKSEERIKLLVVEDDPAMQVAFRDVLNGAGFEVLTASNGEAALKLLRDTQPALILSDIGAIRNIDDICIGPNATADPSLRNRAFGSKGMCWRLRLPLVFGRRKVRQHWEQGSSNLMHQPHGKNTPL